MPSSHYTRAKEISSNSGMQHSAVSDEGAHIPRHMVWSTTAIALDRRERRHVQSPTRRWHARRKTKVLPLPLLTLHRLIRTHTRNMPKMAAILSSTQRSAFAPILTREYIHSIFGWSPAGGGWGIPPGCGRCRRTSSIVWPRRCAALCMRTTRAPVYGSCSRAVPATYSSRRCGRL